MIYFPIYLPMITAWGITFFNIDGESEVPLRPLCVCSCILNYIPQLIFMYKENKQAISKNLMYTERNGKLL